jgi:hypothetical protein
MKPETLLSFIIALVAIGGIMLWSMGYKPAPTTAQVIAEQVALLEEQCTAACGEGGSEFLLAIPPEARLYTTAEATCITYGKALFCSRCDCSMVPDTQLEPGQYTCSFRRGESLALQCTTFINS